MGVGYLVVRERIQSVLSTKGRIKITQTPSPTGWTTYTTSAYGFLFSYPTERGIRFLYENTQQVNKGKNLVQLAEITIGIPDSDGVFGVTVWSNHDRLSAEEWWENNFRDKYADKSLPEGFIRREDFITDTKKVGENDVFVVHNENKPGPEFYIQNSKYVIEAIPALNEGEQILSTLRFNSKESAKLTSWKTYRSINLGYEFQYPGSWIVRESEGGATYFSPPAIGNPLEEPVPAISLEFISKSFEPVKDEPGRSDIQNLTIGDLQGQKYEQEGAPFGGTYVVLPLRGGTIQFFAPNRPFAKSTILKMVNSLKIL